MCDATQPLVGADSDIYRTFDCLVELYDEGRVNVRVHAIGPIGAKAQARETARARGLDVMAVLQVTEREDSK